MIIIDENFFINLNVCDNINNFSLNVDISNKINIERARIIDSRNFQKKNFVLIHFEAIDFSNAND